MSTTRVPYPTLLKTPRLPPWVDLEVQWTWPTEHVVDLPPSGYVVQQSGALWHVRVKDTLELIYAGPGPVELIESPAPF